MAIGASSAQAVEEEATNSGNRPPRSSGGGWPGQPGAAGAHGAEEAGIELPEKSEIAELLTSELVTNALITRP